MYARRVSETLSLHQTLFVKPVKRKILTKFYDLQICLKEVTTKFQLHGVTCLIQKAYLNINDKSIFGFQISFLILISNFDDLRIYAQETKK